MDVIVDPSQIVAGRDIKIFVDSKQKFIEIKTPMTARALYSYCKQQWIDSPHLIKYHFPWFVTQRQIPGTTEDSDNLMHEYRFNHTYWNLYNTYNIAPDLDKPENVEFIID